MRSDPVSLFLRVIQTMLGWAIVIYVTQAVGFWLGKCLGDGKLYSPCEGLSSFPLCAVGWVLAPHLLIPLGVMALSWYLPIRFEGGRLKVYAAAANLITWTIVVAWVVRISPFW